ncbi:MAG: 4-oxalocrotonate tautomerase family protein [Thiotrichales bacterium]|nr:4-oxalocrotonate tautomerase family protein [Thiotrichales bacterium]
MPLIQVNVFKDELNQQQSAELINKITQAVTEVTSEKLRDLTWVLINEVKDGQWGVGGQALGLEDVKKIIAGN